MWQSGFQRGQPAIKTRFYGRKRRGENVGNFLEGELFVKTEEKHLAIVGGNLQERNLDGLLVFARDENLQRRGGAVIRRFVGLIGLGIGEVVQAGNFLAARDVDHQVASDGEEPGLEFGFLVVLMTTLQDAHPGFLEEIFGERAVAGEEEEIPIKAMLILLDEAIEKVGVAATETCGEG